ncbi:MAG: hypothetical protein WCX73_02180 [Candidatus Pacearchaeota archaeon]|jgi:hypothetical protein
MKKDVKIYLVLTLIVLIIIVGIFYVKENNTQTPEEKTMKCISNKATLYSRTTCSHCMDQKEILGQYASLFKITECDETPQLCPEITGTPTWEINGKLYSGVKSIKELADLTNCECNANINVVKNNTEICDVNNQNNTCTTEVQNICS